MHFVPVQPEAAPGDTGQRVRRGRRFLWELVWVLLAVVAAMWLLQHLPGPTFEWREVIEALHVPRRREAACNRLAVLGLVLIGVVYVLKILRSK